MNRETSIYLDLVRFIAALFVFFTHASWQQSSGGLLWQLGFGREAVDVFFVLSGFVIGHVVETHERSPLAYAVARAARLYSVALPALALTFVLDRIGQPLRPDLYTVWCCDLASPARQYFGSLVFLNEIWSQHAPPGSALPYWSLGFEAWYYVAFGLAFFAPRPWNLIAAALVLLAVGPGIAVLFPLWLLGFYCLSAVRAAAAAAGCRGGPVRGRIDRPHPLSRARRIATVNCTRPFPSRPSGCTTTHRTTSWAPSSRCT